MRTNVLLALFGLLLGLGLLEVTLRFILPKREGQEFTSIQDYRRAILDSEAARKSTRNDGVVLAALVNPHPDDRIIYELQPHLDVDFAYARVRTNSCGLRGPERPVQKPPGVFRIALLGDSYAFGWGVAQDKSFAQVLEDNLNRLTAGRPKVEIVNFAVPGYSTFQEVTAFKEKGLDYDPDVVLVFFTHNDFDFPFFVRDPGSATGLIRSFSLGRIGQDGLDPRLADTMTTMQSISPPEMLVELGRMAKVRGIKTFLTVNPRGGWRETIQRLGKTLSKAGIEYIDLVPEFDSIVKRYGYTAQQLDHAIDSHPSELRAGIYGNLLTPRLWAEIDRSKPALGFNDRDINS